MRNVENSTWDREQIPWGFQEGETSVGGMHGKGHKTKDIKLELGLDEMGSGWVCRGLFSCSDTVADSGEARHMQLFKGPWVRLICLRKASLQQRSHNPKPGKDDRPWHVWHFSWRSGLMAQASPGFMWALELGSMAGSTTPSTFENYSFKCESSSLKAGRLPSGLGHPELSSGRHAVSLWSHAALGARCVTEGGGSNLSIATQVVDVKMEREIHLERYSIRETSKDG